MFSLLQQRFYFLKLVQAYLCEMNYKKVKNI